MIFAQINDNIIFTCYWISSILDTLKQGNFLGTLDSVHLLGNRIFFHILFPYTHSCSEYKYLEIHLPISINYEIL